MEKRDLYDLNRVLTGETVFKGESYPLDRKILVVVIWIENSKGKLLIQKRSDAKGGRWATTGGHPKAGQTSLEGIITEVKEELGIDLTNDDIKFIGSNDDELVFCDVYYTKLDIELDDIVLQEEEVSYVTWMSTNEVKKLQELDIFQKKHYKSFKHYLNYKKTLTDD